MEDNFSSVHSFSVLLDFSDTYFIPLSHIPTQGCSLHSCTSISFIRLLSDELEGTFVGGMAASSSVMLCRWIRSTRAISSSISSLSLRPLSTMAPEQPADTEGTTEPRRSGRIASRPNQPAAAEVKAKAPRAVKKRTTEQSNDSVEAEGSTSKKVRTMLQFNLVWIVFN